LHAKKLLLKTLWTKNCRKHFKQLCGQKDFAEKVSKTLWTKMFCRKFCDKDYAEILEGHKIHQKDKEKNQCRCHSIYGMRGPNGASTQVPK
jgi:hypothetical protein